MCSAGKSKARPDYRRTGCSWRDRACRFNRPRILPDEDKCTGRNRGSAVPVCPRQGRPPYRRRCLAVSATQRARCGSVRGPRFELANWSHQGTGLDSRDHPERLVIPHSKLWRVSRDAEDPRLRFRWVWIRIPRRWSKLSLPTLTIFGLGGTDGICSAAIAPIAHLENLPVASFAQASELCECIPEDALLHSRNILGAACRSEVLPM